MKERVRFTFFGEEVTGTAVSHTIDETGDFFLVRLDSDCVGDDESYYVYCPIVEAQPLGCLDL